MMIINCSLCQKDQSLIRKNWPSKMIRFREHIKTHHDLPVIATMEHKESGDIFREIILNSEKNTPPKITKMDEELSLPTNRKSIEPLEQQ